MMNLHRCPLCNSVGVLHPGEPPSTQPHNYYNRCSGKALTGDPGNFGSHVYRFDDSWRFLRSHPSELCGFPMTDEQGAEIKEPIPLRDLISMTREKFSVDALKDIVMDQHHQSP